MDLKIGDRIELKNKSIATITFIGESLEGQIVYGVGKAPIIVVSLENIVRKVED